MNIAFKFISHVVCLFLLICFIQLTPVNTVAFTVQASDADNDKILYSIDQTSVSLTFKPLNEQIQEKNQLLIVDHVSMLQPDAEYFRIDLPNSGEVILSKPLDYETKTQLTVTIYASVSCFIVALFLSNLCPFSAKVNLSG